MKVARLWLMLFVVLGYAHSARAQATGSIAGTVKDSSGAVLPGVTVEASSPALIEKVRSVVSDSNGQYKIVDLRPGTYAVSATLTGFNVFKREGIELSAGFTATVNPELKVGSMEETITVSGASPIVDVQNSRSQQVLKTETLNSLPSGSKNLMAFAAMTLGAVPSNRSLNDVGGDKGEQASGIILHGGRGDDGRTNWDGMNTNVFFGGGGGKQRTYYFNTAAVQEVVVDTGGNNAESETGGANVNMVPKEGGNSIKVYGTANYTDNRFSAKAIPQSLKDRGLTDQSSLKKIYDYAVGIGGPIKQDKIWFYGTQRSWGSQNYGANNYFNKSTDKRFYVPDLDRPAFADTFFSDSSFRVTWQAASKHKFNQEEHFQNGCSCWLGIGGGALSDPTATTDFNYGPQILSQTTWAYTATNKLLIQAGASFLRQEVNFVNGVSPNASKFTGIGTPVFPDASTFSILEQTGFGATPANYRYNALPGGLQSYGTDDDSNNYNQKLTVSYVTGSHAFKTGVQTIQGHYDFFGMQVPNQVTYIFRGGVPSALQEFAGPFQSYTRLKGLGIFAQDQWTLNKLTLNLGVRYDGFQGRTLPQDIPAGTFIAARHVDELKDLPNYKDITPRIGAAYDIFGNGKTAIKASFGKYLFGQGGGLSQQGFAPSVAIVSNVTRTWNDANGNYVPDCVLTNPLANGECTQISNLAFGQPVTNLSITDDARKGWNHREYNYQTSVQLAHELRPGLGLAVGYFRTWWGNQNVTVNSLVSASDFTEFCVTNPVDDRLEGRSGQKVCGFYDVNPNKFGQVNSVVDLAKKQGLGTPEELFNGVDVGINARFAGGKLVNGGISFGRETVDWCYANGHPELTPQNFPANYPRNSDYCRVTSSWWDGIGSQAKAQVVYPMKYDVIVSGTFKTLPGVNRTLNLVSTSAQIAAQNGGRLLSGGAATATTATVPIASNGDSSQGTLFDDRLYETDLRIGKGIRVGKSKVQGNFDIYNVFNSRAPQAVNATYSAAAWLRPTSLLGGRLFKFAVQFDF